MHEWVFCIAYLLEVSRNNIYFFNFIDLKLLQIKMPQNIPIKNSRQNCFYRKDSETRKTPKKKEKTELKFSIYQKQVKAKFPTEIADI